MRLNNDLKLWLYIIIPTSIALQLIAFTIFKVNTIANIFDFNSIIFKLGSLFGVSGLMLLIARPKALNW